MLRDIQTFEDAEQMSETPKPRTEMARAMLSFANRGVEALQASPKSSWVALWAGTVALLRSAVHAAEKDAMRDPRLHAAQKAWWAWLCSHKSNPGSKTKIFWHLIDLEKNDNLHHAIINASQSVVIHNGRATYSYKMISGPYEGYDSTDLAVRAAAWVNEQLEWIEANALANGPPKP